MRGFPDQLRDRFEPQRELGSGAMGTVYLATDRQLGRPVAIKLVLDTRDPEMRERFLREVEGLARLRHPNVMQVYDWGLLGDSPYLVIEFLDGRPLDEWESQDLGDLACQLADALEAVHGAGLVHRDLKPANAIRCHDGRVVLTDFGLVRTLDRTALTASGNVVGSLGFLGPEVLRGAVATPATDWFALGVTLYMLAELRMPYTTEQVLAATTGQAFPPPRLKRTPAESPVGRLVLALLDEDPDRRPASRAAIEACLRGEPPLAEPEPLPAVPATSRRRPLAIAAGLMVLGVGLGFQLSSPPPAPVEPTLPSTRTAPSAPAETFPEDWPERVRAELERVAELMVEPSGDVREPPDGTPPAGWAHALDGDPVRFSRVASRMQELARFHRFLGEGRSPEEFSPSLVRELKICDSWYRRRGLLPPFEPYLEPPRAESAEMPALMSLKNVPPEVRYPRGWLAEGARAYRAAQAYLEDRRAELAEHGAKVAEDEPDAAAVITFRTLRGGEVKFDSIVQDLFRPPETRRFVSTWLRPGQVHLLRMLHALGRAVREGGARAEAAGLLGWWACNRLKALWYGLPSYLPVESLLGPEPDSPAGWALRAGVLWVRLDVQRVVVGDHLGDGTAEAFHQAWPKALQEGTVSSPHAVQRYVGVLGVAVEDLRKNDRRRQLEELWKRERARLKELGAQGGLAWFQLLQAWDEEDLRLEGEDLLAMRESLDGALKAFPIFAMFLKDPLKRLRYATR